MAVLPRAHGEAWALAPVGAVGQLSSLPFPQALPEGLINGVIYPGSKLGYILIYCSALQGCMIGKEVVSSALAMSGVPAYSKPLTSFWCNLQLLGWSLLLLGDKGTPRVPQTRKAQDALQANRQGHRSKCICQA